MAKDRKRAPSSGWNLYWVYSDGFEDCFVVARNIRSAIRLERDANGFDQDEVGAVHVCSIPEPLARRKLAEYRKERISWPWYGWEDLLKKLGAEFRQLVDRHETLIDGVVYSQGMPPRRIGRRFIEDFHADPMLATYGEEDRYSERQNILFTLLGLCVARCQEIEHYIAHSFILAVSAREKRRYATINDLVHAWKGKTFLEQRNKLVHGLTTHEQYDIQTAWGQDEMIAFLALFEMMSRPIRKAFRACYLVSMDFGNTRLLESPDPKIRFTRKQQDEMSLFGAFFKLREQNVADV